MSKARVPVLDLFDRPTMLMAGGTLLLFALGVAVAASGWDEFAAGRAFRKGLAAWREGRFLEAAEAGEEAARIIPGYEDAEFLALAVKARTGELTTPEAVRKACPGIDVDCGPWKKAGFGAQAAMQVALLQAGQVGGTLVADLDQIARREPAAAEPLVNLAAYWARQGDLDRTEGFLRKVLAGKETGPAGWRATVESLMGLATIAERRGSLADALRHMDQARWVAGRAEPPPAGSNDRLPGLILSVELRLERLRLLASLAAGTLTEKDVAAAEALVRKTEGVPGIDPAAAARLANLTGVILVREAKGVADGPPRARADAMFAAAERRLPAPGVRDPVTALNRLSLSAGVSRSIPAPGGQALADWRAVLASVPPDRLPPQAAAAAGHNRVVLDVMAGENPDLAVRRLEEAAARGAANPVAWRNLAVLYARMDLPAKADECRRQAESLDGAAR